MCTVEHTNIQAPLVAYIARGTAQLNDFDLSGRPDAFRRRKLDYRNQPFLAFRVA